MWVFCLQACLCTTCVPGTEEVKGVRSPGTGVTGMCELSYRCWDLNIDPLEEEPMLSTAEPCVGLF